MLVKSYWTLAILMLACCHLTKTNATQLSDMFSILSPKTISCYKCSSLTSSACKNITFAANKENLIEECKEGAKGCVKQVVERLDGSKVTFRECYYAKTSTFLFTNLVCEKIDRTAYYEKALCYKCSGNRCNSSNRLLCSNGSWSHVLGFLLIAFILKM